MQSILLLPKKSLFICGLLSLLSACGGGSEQDKKCLSKGGGSAIIDCLKATSTPAASVTPRSTPSPTAAALSATPQQGFVNIAPNIKLEYLDFGGTGEPILLLAGAGNSAHVFEGFAQGLTAKNRVFALTRRGYGASSQPATGYDNATLTEDIRLALDQLGIYRVHLIGHSIAGDEMTRFAGLYPERVNRLVYLDAAIDRVSLADDILKVTSSSGFIEPSELAATPADLASLDSLHNYSYRINGIHIPKAELQATFRFASDGTFAGAVTPDEISTQHIMGVERPNYSRVKARALAIFPSMTSAVQLYPWLTPASPEWAASNTFATNIMAPFFAKQQAKVGAELIGSRTLLIPNAVHHLFLSHPKQVTDAILQFLAAP